jgi:hypothetical protein
MIHPAEPIINKKGWSWTSQPFGGGNAYVLLFLFIRQTKRPKVAGFSKDFLKIWGGRLFEEKGRPGKVDHLEEDDTGL